MILINQSVHILIHFEGCEYQSLHNKVLHILSGLDFVPEFYFDSSNGNVTVGGP